MTASRKLGRRALPVLTTALFTIFLTAIPVLAAEGAVEDSGGFTPTAFFRWLNFIIVFGGIAYLIAKHGQSYFRANAQAIAAGIAEASAAKAEADRELHEVETKIARLDQEIAELREAARRDSMPMRNACWPRDAWKLKKSSRPRTANWPLRNAPRSRSCAPMRLPWRWSVPERW